MDIISIFRYRSKLNEKVWTTPNSIVWCKGKNITRSGSKPAILYSNGTKFWYLNGIPRRDDNLPAIIWFTGEREWYENGRLKIG
jgi:hypothetical protein